MHLVRVVRKFIAGTIYFLFFQVTMLASSGNSITYPIPLDLRKPVLSHNNLNDFEPYASILIDSAGTLSIDQILSLEHQPFDDTKQKIFDLLNPDFKAVWIRIQVIPPSDSNEIWLLALNHPEIEFFFTKDNKLLRDGSTGTHIQNPSDFLHFFPTPVINLNQFSGLDSHMIYIRIIPKLFTTMGIRPLEDYNRKIFHTDSFVNYFKTDYTISFLSLGILIVLFLYHIIFYIFSREPSYGWFSACCFAYICILLFFKGFLVSFFNIDQAGLLYDFGFLIVYMLWLAVIPFAISYLDLRQEIPNWSKVLSFILYFLAGSFLSLMLVRLFSNSLFRDIQSISTTLLQPVIFVLQLLLFSVGLLSLKKRIPNALFYVAGMSMILLTHVLNLLTSSQILQLPENFPYDIPGAISQLAFAFGLAYQYKINEEKRQEAEKQKALSDQLRHLDRRETARLKELDHFKSQLYTNITHEFRTPLTVISGMADQIQGNTTEKNLIIRNSESLLDLVNQMLQLNKLDAGQLQPNLVQIDIIPLIRYLSETFQNLADSHDKQFILEVLDPNIWLDTDPNLLERIINNLVHNAIKFTPERGQIRLRASHDGKAESCTIAVCDNGRGIPIEDLPHIFDRFYQVNRTTTREGEGTGIGLALAKELTELLDGNIEVQSELHRGSTFIVCLPVHHQAPLQSWQPSRKRPTSTDLTDPNVNEPITPDADLPKILIVEDHQDVRQYLSRLLTSRYQIVEAYNGRHALSLAYQEIPDLIISDIMMPEMDGFELCQNIKTDQRTSHIPVILLTAKSSQDDRLEGLKGGADAYLTKPFDKRELFIRIEKLLESRIKLQHHYQQFQMLPKEAVEENKFLDRIRTIIESNLNNEQFQIEDLANEIHLSRTQLYRKLKALTGKTFTAILKEMRIHRAQELLTKTDKTIGEIAFELGFRDQSYFTKVFRDRVGLSPSSFRSMQ